MQHTATHCNTQQLTHTGTHTLELKVMSEQITINILEHTATHRNTLQHTATHCNTLQHPATHCNERRSPSSATAESANICRASESANMYRVSESANIDRASESLMYFTTRNYMYSATHTWGVLSLKKGRETIKIGGQAPRDGRMQYTATHSTHCNTLQHNATHCNTLQHTATHCNTLQHTEGRSHCF